MIRKRQPELRSLSSCPCNICNVARMSINEYRKTKKKRGQPVVTSSKTPDQASSYKICSNCFAKIYKGCSHSAESCRYSRRNNVVNI